MPNLKVAMVAPPWIRIPPNGYGGIENVIDGLVSELVKLKVQVELFSTGDSEVAGATNHWLYPDGQYHHLAKVLYEVSPIAIAQVLFALKEIKAAGDFDIIHDHNGFIGPAVMAQMCQDDFPPVLHTYHGPPFVDRARGERQIPDLRPMFQQLVGAKQLYIVGISDALMKGAPKELKPLLVDPVHNSVDLAKFPFKKRKQDYFITLARFSPEKGQAIAARLCEELGLKLRMAGIVAGIASPRQLLLELANPLSRFRNNSDFKYYSDKVFPLLNPGQIDYVGNVKGDQKMEFLSNAKALLWPIDWEEPFGLVPIEALACGTPVVAMRRGAVPEMIEHGVNGFIADTEAEFKDYIGKVDQIDPAACRRSVADKFSTSVMAKRYLDRYQQIISKHKK